MSARDSSLPPSPAPAPGRVDAYLSRKAQGQLDPGAVVFERPDGTWALERPGQPPVALGASFGRAREALAVLFRAAEAARRAPSDTR